MTDKWVSRYMELAKHIATWSKDRSRQTGCVVVGPTGEIRATGFNGFPRGVDDDIEERHQRPAKYLWTEHAERNAIYNAASVGVRLSECVMYVPWYPCTDCARAIIQSDIVQLVCYKPDFSDPKWGDEFRLVEIMLKEGGVLTKYVEGSIGAAK
jgi:dCMP deaminase